MILPLLTPQPEPQAITDELKAEMAGHGRSSFTQGTPGAKKIQRKENKRRKRLSL